MRAEHKELVSGVIYTSIARYAGIFVTMIVVAILSRLFSPEEFGVISIATVIIGFFAIFSDLGFGPAVVQHKELNEKDLSNIFSLTVWLGALMALLFLALAPLIARFYDSSEQLLYVCRVLSVSLFFSAINIVPNALILKDKRFRFVAGRTLAVQLAGGTASIIAALSGAGIYALTINPILSGIVLFVVNFREHPLRLRLHIAKASLMKVLSFSVYQFCFQLLNFFSRNLDRLLIGRYLGKAELGYYDKSYQLMMYPLQNIAYVVSPVMHPIFSELQHDPRHLADSYLKVIRILAFIGLPLTAVLTFSSRELILLFFGGQWEASVPVFRLLSLTVGIQIIMSTSGAIFQAANATRMLFVCGLFSSVLNVTAICTGIFYFRSTEAVAGCLCISFFINFIQCYYVLFRSTLRHGWGAFWRALVSPIGLTFILCLPLGAMYLWLPDLSLIASLVLKCTSALLIWIAWIQMSGIFNIRGFIAAKLLHRP